MNQDYKEFNEAILSHESYEKFFYENLIENNPDYDEAYFPLADLYTRLGMYEEGLKLDIHLSEKYPEDESVWYNLTCSYTLCGKIELAFDALRRAFDSGFSDVDLLQTDSDLDNIRRYEEYNQMLSELLSRSIP